MAFSNLIHPLCDGSTAPGESIMMNKGNPFSPMSSILSP